MIYNLKEYAEKDLQLQMRLLKKCRMNLGSAPGFTISASERDGKVYYYKNKSGKKIYLGHGDNPDVLTAQKYHFLNELTCRTEGNVTALEKFLQHYKPINPEIIASESTLAYKQIPFGCLNFLGSKDASSWEYGYYSKSSKHQEGLVHHTAKGDYVRSKSEVIIANTLFANNIPYHYEEILVLDDRTELVPDFTILIPSENRYKFLEHVGMLSNPDYYKNFIWKFETYIHYGYIPWQDVFFTFDSLDGSIDGQHIDRLLGAFLK